MLLKIADHIKRANILGKKYIGIVVENNDPRRIGRVKCVIEGLLEGNPDALPWVFPHNPSGQGGRGDTSAIEIPEIGSQLVIEFPFDDVYSPFYTGFWQSEETHQGEFDEDYPNTRGWQDSDGTFFRVNAAKRLTQFRHASGSSMAFQKDGTIEIVSPKAVRLMSEDGKAVLSLNAESGDIEFNNRNKGKLAGSQTEITSKRHTVDVGSVDDKATGSREVRTGGGYKHVVGGGASESIVGNRGASVGGDVDETVVGEIKRIIGQGRKEKIATGGDEEIILEGDRKYNLTLGNFLVNITAGDATIQTLAGSTTVKNAIGSFEIDKTGGITVKNAVGTFEITPLGDFTFKNAVGTIEMNKLGDIKASNPAGGLSIDKTGKVALGSQAAELVDQVIQAVDSLLPASQPNLCMTGIGPSGPLLPPAALKLTLIKTMLTTIKGSL